mgnify:CR=1 FL=1
MPVESIMDAGGLVLLIITVKLIGNGPMEGVCTSVNGTLVNPTIGGVKMTAHIMAINVDETSTFGMTSLATENTTSFAKVVETVAVNSPLKNIIWNK